MSVLGVIVTGVLVIGILIGSAYLVKKLRLVSYYKELAEDSKKKEKDK